MDNYVTGKIIKELREKQKMTQLELANKLCVSDKTISKWETGRGLPDISIIESLAKSLKVSVAELIIGEYTINKNKSSNMLKSKFYVCPVCGNVIHTVGEIAISCCGINLPVLETEQANSIHEIVCAKMENEIFVSLSHEMSKSHYISFIAYVTNDRCEIIKLYPEQNAETRFFNRGTGIIYAYCNKDGLFKKNV